uniref:Uncharacterized protein n=1 Tax=Xenopus tropicalis TaxID=8364 RepID=A0A1B8XWW7_XENTR
MVEKPPTWQLSLGAAPLVIHKPLCPLYMFLCFPCKEPLGAQNKWPLPSDPDFWALSPLV